MTPKVIKNLEEYEEALEEYDALLDVDPDAGTPDAIKLELLSHLIGEYEEREFPIDLPDPIEAIKFRMEQQNLKQRDLVPYMGSPSKVSEVLNGKRALSLKMIRSLHEHLHIPAEALMGSKGAKIPIKSSIEWGSFPLKYMYDRGWLKNAPKTWAKAKDMAEELIKPLWDNYRTLCAAPLLTRQTKTIRAKKNIDYFSLTAWALRVVDRAKDIVLLNSYDSINDDFMMELARLSLHFDGPRLAEEFLGSHGICLIIEPHLEKTFLDGAAIMLRERKPVLGLTIRHDRIDSFWFCLMHEVAHLRLHLEKNSESFFDDLEYYSRDKREKEADRLAEEMLVPGKIWTRYPDLRYVSEAEVKSISQEIRRHPAVVAGQIQHKLNDYVKFGQFVKRYKVKRWFPEFATN
jgi:HTH-type transcriptional regulator/antitoxin HigA